MNFPGFDQLLSNSCTRPVREEIITNFRANNSTLVVYIHRFACKNIKAAKPPTFSDLGALVPSIIEEIQESQSTKERLKQQAKLIEDLANLMIDVFEKGGKVLFCGNGGSAADSQHLAGELVGQVLRLRKALPAIALTTNSSLVTSIANDQSFGDIFARQAEALIESRDLLIGISAGGNSENVLRATEIAKKNGCRTAALIGKTGGKLKDMVNLAIVVPSDNTQRIQESHILIGHIVCGIVESFYLDKQK